jgi:hypothetical protein
LFIFSSSAITLTPNLRPERSKFHILSTFAYVLCVFGCPLLGSSCTSSRISWTACAFRKHSISSERIHHKPLLIGLRFQ